MSWSITFVPEKQPCHKDRAVAAVAINVVTIKPYGKPRSVRFPYP